MKRLGYKILNLTTGEYEYDISLTGFGSVGIVFTKIYVFDTKKAAQKFACISLGKKHHTLDFVRVIENDEIYKLPTRYVAPNPFNLYNTENSYV
jgi:hypothetical protein